MAADARLIPLWVAAYCDGRVRDVQIDAKLLTIAAGGNTKTSFSLKALAAKVGITLEKDSWRLRYKALRGVPIKYWPQGAVDYSADDMVATRAVHLANERDAAQWANARIVVLGQHANLAAAAAWALHLASCHGVCTDPKRTADLADKVHAHLKEIRGNLVNAGLVRRTEDAAAVRAWNKQLRELERSGTPKALAKAQLEIAAQGCPDGKRSDTAAAHRMVQVMTQSGRRASIALSDTGELQLEARKRAGEDPRAIHEEFISRLEYVKLDKDCAIASGDELLIARADYASSHLLLGRVERMKQGYTLPLQTRFNLPQDTFRTSSSQPDEPVIGEQMQNFPRGKKEDAYGLRETFTPRRIVRGPWGDDDGIFVGADFAQFELHALAQVCFKLFGWTRMGELLNANVDVHWYFAAKSLGITVEQVKALADAGSHRDRAKPLDFGIPGGMGPDKIIEYSRKGYGVKFTRDEVVHLRGIWLNDTFPEVQEMFSWTNAHLDGRRSFTHIHPITGYVRGGCGYTDGNNENFQHLAAYAALCAVVQVTRACFTPGSPLFGWRLWNFIHDEILLEGPKRGASAAAIELERIMVAAANPFMPNYPVHAEPFVTSVWSKKCKTVRAPDGTVLEWKPAA